MTTILQFLIRSIPIFLAIIIPGFLLALALLKKTKLSLFEIFIIGIPLGMSTPAILSFIEFLVGIPFSPALVFVNIAIITLIGIFLIVKEKVDIKNDIKNIIMELQKFGFKSIAPHFILAIILIFAFWIRIQALSPYFYDFDPYWYNSLTQFILTEGGVPPYDDLAWYPNIYSHRNLAHVQYISANWYSIYAVFNGIQHFDFELMTMVSSLYPPLVAALMCFFGYLWLSHEYNKKIGLMAAALLAFSPTIVDKMLAGSFELAPWGFFTIVFFYAAYYLTLKYNSKRFAVLSSFAIFVSIIGAPASIIPNALLTVTILIISFVFFFRNSLSLDFLKLNGIIISGAIAGGILQSTFYNSLIYSNFISLASLLVVGILFYLQEKRLTIEDKLIYLSLIFIVGIIAVVVTPIGKLIEGYTATFFYVVSYTNPTMQTIAEQTAAPSDFSYSLGVLGLNIEDILTFIFGSDVNISISLTPLVLLFSFLTALISLFSLSFSSIMAIVGVYPISLFGLLKAKYTVYLGITVPIAFCILIGEISRMMKKYSKYIIIFGALITFLQFVQYYDLIFYSFSISKNVDVTNNTLFFSTVCDTINTNSQKSYQNIINSSFARFAPFVVKSMSLTQRVYCSRIPDWWLNVILWIRENRRGDERIFSWWDYGHWTTTIGQGKSVTDNLHNYPIMHQEVADKLVSNTPEALAEYMKEHKAKYLLLDQDLIGKWGALVYHSCIHSNKTTMDIGPGNSDCDRLYSPEILFVSKKPTTKDLCNIKIEEGPALKVYSTMSKYYNFQYYCAPGGKLPFIYENGTEVGISDVNLQGETNDGYYILTAQYPSDHPDRKGYYYDSIFYKGFFEGGIPGFVQVYPDIYVSGPKLPVRIYKLKE